MTAATNRALDLHPGPDQWIAAYGMPSNSTPSETTSHLQHMRGSLLSDDWPYAVKAFRKLMGLALPPTPTPFEPLAKMLHASLLSEEVSEFAAADGVVEQANGLLDIIYVAIGALLHLGLTGNQIQAGFNEVHCSNMTKVQDNGRPLVNDGILAPELPIGKVLKTSNYTRPDMATAMSLT